MQLGSALLTVSLLLAANPDEPRIPIAPDNVTLPSATQQALPAPAAPALPARAADVAPAVESVAPVPTPTMPSAGVVSGTAPLLQNTGIVKLGPCATGAPANGWPTKTVWGEVDIKGFPDAGRIAPNGISYDPLFSADLNFNFWLWRSQGLYVNSYARYWGERGTPGQTQGNFDYTRREFDLDVALAWNYYGFLELRFVGYGHENFNRGVSLVSPGGTTNDGAGLEQRLYLSDEYAKLGQDGFNISRATFLSVGYYPTKSLIGLDGQQFHPGAFARAYLIYDLTPQSMYLFLDLDLICDKSFVPRRLDSDVGVAIAPFEGFRLLEFRFGSEFNTGFTPGGVRNMSLPYFSVRLNY